MKAIFTSVLILIYFYCSSQEIGVKFNNPKTFIVKESITIITDSITISNINDNCLNAVVCDVTYYSPSTSKDFKQRNIVVWEGADYVTNHNWTKNQLKQRVKDLLNQ